MKYTTAVAAALVAGVSASYSPGWAPPSGGEGEGAGWGESSAAGWAAPTKSWVTEVMTAYTTFCPEATQITHGGTTYSVTEATTLTIPGPATVSYPVTVSTYSSCTSCSAPAPPPTWSSAPAPPPESYSKPAPPPSWSSAPAPPPSSAPAPPASSAPAPPPAPPASTPASPVIPAPPVGTAPPAYSVPANGTVPKPSGTGVPGKTTPAGPVYTGAASALKAGSAGLAAVFGLVAYAL